MSQKKIILHWLNASRSQRVLWLLEELNITYEIKYYNRDKGYRAPPELKAVHPTGKSPIIEVVADGSEPLVIAETGHIFSYLLRHYDNNNKLTPTDEQETEEVDYYLHYSEGTFQSLLVAVLIHSMAKKQAPFGTKSLVGTIVGVINDKYYGPEILQNLDILEAHMKKQHNKSSEYFVGNKLTGADIMLSFPIAENAFGPDSRVVTQGKFDLKDKYPNLSEWSKFIKNEPGYIKANQIIKNHYKL